MLADGEVIHHIQPLYCNCILRLFDRDNALYITEPDCSHKADVHL